MTFRHCMSVCVHPRRIEANQKCCFVCTMKTHLATKTIKYKCGPWIFYCEFLLLSQSFSVAYYLRRNGKVNTRTYTFTLAHQCIWLDDFMVDHLTAWHLHGLKLFKTRVRARVNTREWVAEWLRYAYVCNCMNTEFISNRIQITMLTSIHTNHYSMLNYLWDRLHLHKFQ